MKKSLFHASTLASEGLLAIFGIPYLGDLCLHLHMMLSLCAFLWPNVPFSVGTPVILDWGLTLL